MDDLDAGYLLGGAKYIKICELFLGAEVKVYRVYLAESAFPLSAAERYWISPEVEVGSSLALELGSWGLFG